MINKLNVYLNYMDKVIFMSQIDVSSFVMVALQHVCDNKNR